MKKDEGEEREEAKKKKEAGEKEGEGSEEEEEDGTKQRRRRVRRLHWTRAAPHVGKSTAPIPGAHAGVAQPRQNPVFFVTLTVA